MSKQFLVGAAATTLAVTAVAATPSLGVDTQREMSAPVVVRAPNLLPTQDLLGQDVDYSAAAQKELMATPTRHFTLSARFGEPGANWSTGHHTGLDFVVPVGTPVFAADSGKVVMARPEGAYGNLIEIKHADGTRTRYAHLSTFDVKKGQTVQRGARIGQSGCTGNTTGPHLHFEVVVGKKPVDPQRFL